MTQSRSVSNKARSKFTKWGSRIKNFMQETGTRNLWLASGLLICGLSLTTVVALYFKKEADKAGKRKFDFNTSEIQLNIAGRLADNAQVLFSGAALFDSSETVTRDERRVFTEQLIKRYL